MLIENSINVLQCDDVTRFAKLSDVFVRTDQPIQHACRSKWFCPKTNRKSTTVLCTGCKALVHYLSFLIHTLHQTEEQIGESVSMYCGILLPLKIQKEEVSIDMAQFNLA